MPPTFGPAPTFGPTPQPTLPGFDPYGNPLLGTPPADVPYNAAPYNAAPQFSPTGPISPAPTIAQPQIPQQSGSIYPSGLPYQWESGAYQYQNSDGTVVRLQRFLQQISFEHTWIYGEHAFDELEINRSELSATFGIPIFYNPNTPLLVTPGFAFNWLEGPVSSTMNSGADLPPRVYDAYLDVAWHPQLTDWLHADLGLRTGVWTDFKEVNSESIRILGRGLAVLSFSPQCDVLVGVWYLDRNRVTLLPAGGVHLRPSPDLDAYLVFPNPKIRKRSISIGSSQWWVYVAGEYGGGRWTIERANGMADDIDYNDLRAIFGFEWETQTQARGHVEVGYVFDRELLFDKMPPAQLKLDDSFMVRAGFDF
ncbi:MAG: hypothetical protein IH831_00405 [Planctomycetes bacterium]|nr:hypothetical protein [Planctomycetota bacterium]